MDINARMLAPRLSEYLGQQVVVENRPGAGTNIANELVVNAKLPVQNVKELIAMARSSPGKLNYSSAGVGTTQHLAAELFKPRTGTFIVHIPYKGTAPSLAGLMGGEVVKVSGARAD